MRGPRLRDVGHGQPRRGGLDQDDQPGVADDEAEAQLGLGDVIVEQPDVVGAADLRQHEAVDLGRDRCLDVAHGERQRTIDSDQDVGAAAPDPRRVALDQRPRRVLRGGRHAVLEIDLDAIGAALVRFRDETLDVGRDVQQRPPHRQGAGHAGCFPSAAAASLTTPASRSCW
jgi:hypothetical protein